ncbi:N-acetylmannosamine-6-phosphate 2-epimerase [Gracilibacillus salitolerans]|uniref:N-acetylmannosamine-6-phosphate 2-epimerase n=1 Tax=Gracilibacillus salitolerans TaxID=2663022 RepID=UPI001E2BC23A|nr:N-acetylmannosamine-6-phosphate 2-epimerase [Gracilibacillus salitolerans]
MLDKVKNGIIVSCQALEDEPLHSPFIMGRMAKAATEGKAVGIRANSAADIKEIKKNTKLPVIGIVKKDYDDSPIYITPTDKEIKELANTDCEMIALDATIRHRHNNQSLKDFVKKIREISTEKYLMADIATLDEAIQAQQLGFDCVSTTLIGYTEQTVGQNIADNDFDILKQILGTVTIPVLAEGHIDTPEKAKRCLELGAHAVVVGSAITRPQLITRRFTEFVSK